MVNSNPLHLLRMTIPVILMHFVDMRQFKLQYSVTLITGPFFLVRLVRWSLSQCDLNIGKLKQANQKVVFPSRYDYLEVVTYSKVPPLNTNLLMVEKVSEVQELRISSD